MEENSTKLFLVAMIVISNISNNRFVDVLSYVLRNHIYKIYFMIV